MVPMEKKQAFNPYLPGWEYVPDGEPRIFNGRLYVYGSHDRFNGKGFCLNDYLYTASQQQLGGKNSPYLSVKVRICPYRRHPQLSPVHAAKGG